MIKKVLIFIILFIFLYDCYTLYNFPESKKVSEVIKKTTIKDEKIDDIESTITKKDKIQTLVEHSDEIIENISPDLYGKPSTYKPNEYIIWDFNDPQPWNKIVYKYGSKYPFYFFIKVKIPSLNDYQAWKNIIPNIDFDPMLGEIIIPATDEESALSIINLILSNFKGDISIEEIINKNLLEISISKAKKYDVVKNKLIEQIKENTKIKSIKETFEPTFQSDLVVNEPSLSNNDKYDAYQGTEYSFI